MRYDAKFLTTHQEKMRMIKSSGLLNPNESNHKSACDEYFKDISFYKFFEVILDDKENWYDDAINMVMSDSERGGDMVRLAIMQGAEVKIYNDMIRTINWSRAKMPENTALLFNREPNKNFLKNLRALINSKGFNISQIKHVVWYETANIIYQNLAEAGVSESVLMKSMTAKEIMAAGKAVENRGIRLYPEGYVQTYPSQPFMELSQQDLYPLFNLLKELHGPFHAQSLINIEDKHVEEMVFLKKDDLPLEYDIKNKGNELNNFLSSLIKKPGKNSKLIGYIVGAYRNSGCVYELDQLEEKLLKGLIKSGFLVADDVKTMPNTIKKNKKLIVEHDFSI